MRRCASSPTGPLRGGRGTKVPCMGCKQSINDTSSVLRASEIRPWLLPVDPSIFRPRAPFTTFCLLYSLNSPSFWGKNTTCWPGDGGVEPSADPSTFWGIFDAFDKLTRSGVCGIRYLEEYVFFNVQKKTLAGAKMGDFSSGWWATGGSRGK